jgi:hypothetical protein
MSVLYKDPGDIRAYTMDFSFFQELSAVGGDTIASVTSNTITPAGPTLGSSTISGKTVKFTITGGTAGVLYVVKTTIVTSSNAVLVGQGSLFVLANPP